MGADIHVVVEFDHIGPEFLRPTGLAYLEWPRCTDVFVALGAFNGATKVPLRGFPQPCSFLAAQQYGLLVCRDGELHEYGCERAIEETEAIAEVDAGKSHFIDPVAGRFTAISDPAFSYPNWIMLKELEFAYSPFSEIETPLTHSPEFNATKLLLQYLQTQNMASRMVNWFDV